MSEQVPYEKQLPHNQAEPNAYLQDKRSRGWFWDFNEVFDSDLSKNAILVRLYIAKCANGDRQAWPSLNNIAKHCKISKPTVIKALNELEEKMWLKKIIQKRPNDEYANTIYILNDPPAVISLPKKGGSKIVLPPVKNKEGVVNSFNHVVKPLDNLVKPLDPNKTQITIPNIENNNKLFISSLRSDTNNSAVDFQPTDADVGKNSPINNKCDSHQQTGAATTKVHYGNKCDSRPHAGAADETHKGEKLPTGKDLIALLVKEYRAIAGIQKTKGDYAFIGGLYNKYGYQVILEAIYDLSLAVVTQEIDKPLLYLKGIIENSNGAGKTNTKKKKQYMESSEESDKKKEFVRDLYMG